MKDNRNRRFRVALAWFLAAFAVFVALLVGMSTLGGAYILFFGTGGLIIPIISILLIVLVLMALRLLIIRFPRVGWAVAAASAVAAVAYFSEPAMKTKTAAAKHVAQLEQVAPEPVDIAGISGVEMTQPRTVPAPRLPRESYSTRLVDQNCNIYCFDILHSGGADWVRLIAPAGYTRLGLDETPTRMVFAWAGPRECRTIHPAYPAGEGCLVVRRDTGAPADLVATQIAEKSWESWGKDGSGRSYGQVARRVTEAHDAAGKLLFRRQQIIYRPKHTRGLPMGEARLVTKIAPQIDIAADLAALGFSMSGEFPRFPWPFALEDAALKRAGHLVLAATMLDAHVGPFGLAEENQFERDIIADWTSFLAHEGIESEVEQETLCRILAAPRAAKVSRVNDPAAVAGGRPCGAAG